MATKTVLETLEAARKLITPRKSWTRGELARNAKGKKVRPNDPTAIRWCMEGACRRVSPEIGFHRIAHFDIDCVFNDSHTHAEVLAAFDAAIAKEAQHGR